MKKEEEVEGLMLLPGNSEKVKIRLSHYFLVF